VTGISNAHGPQLGGSTVTVTGTAFVASSNMLCRFYLTTVAGTQLSPSTVRCVTPLHATQAVSVEISNNGQDFTATGSVFYTFDRAWWWLMQAGSIVVVVADLGTQRL
jgi:hypothetical protein